MFNKNIDSTSEVTETIAETVTNIKEEAPAATYVTPEDYMGVIPWQLQNEEYRFVGLLPQHMELKNGKKNDGKVPAHKWKESPLQYNSPEMKKHLKRTPAYAVVCGHGNLVVLDVDSELGKELSSKLPETFTTMSGNKQLPHIYLHVDTDKDLAKLDRFVPMTNEEQREWVKTCKGHPTADSLQLAPMIEVRGFNRLAVGANSRIGVEKEKWYGPSSSSPIATVSYEQLEQALENFGVSKGRQFGRLMVRLATENPEALEAMQTDSEEKPSYEETGNWWDADLWQEIVASVTIKDAYEELNGVYKARGRMQCLYTPDCTSHAVSMDKGFYCCFSCKKSRDSWGLYQDINKRRLGNQYDWTKCSLEFAKMAGDKYEKQWAQFLKDYKQASKREKSDEVEKLLEEFNKDHFIAPTGGKVLCFHETANEFGHYVLNAYDARHFGMLDRRKVVVGRKSVGLASLWVNWEGARGYDGISFLPGADGETPDGKRFYNTWRGFNVEPCEGSFEKIAYHLKHVWCQGNEEHYNYLMTWFAHLVQKPEEKPTVAIVVKGNKGAGKSIILELLWAKILGECYAKFDKAEHVTGKFNSLHEGKLLMVLEEAVWAGDKQAEGALKSLISDPWTVIEGKGLNSQKRRSYCRLFFNSNERRAIPATMDERRFFVLNASDEHIADREYFNELVDEIENGGAEAFFKYLLDFKITKDLVRKAPKTAGLLEDAREGFNSFQAWLDELLQEEKCEFTHDGEVMSIEWGKPVKTEALAAHHADWVAEAKSFNGFVGRSNVISKKKMVTELRHLFDLKSVRCGGKRAWVLPEFATARKAFYQSFDGVDGYVPEEPVDNFFEKEEPVKPDFTELERELKKQ